MSFVLKGDYILDKYNKIWDKIKEKLSIKFHSMPVYDETYIKAKVREFDGKIYLEESKYKVKKIQMSRFINAELESDSESESDTELMAKLKSGSDSE